MVSSSWCPPVVKISAAELRNMSIDEIKDTLAFETARADCLGYFDGPAVRRCIDALVDHGIWCYGFTDILFVETDAGGQRYWAAGGRPETDPRMACPRGTDPLVVSAEPTRRIHAEEETCA
jgi:hypothetical protein